jgi:hypothetical protein
MEKMFKSSLRNNEISSGLNILSSIGKSSNNAGRYLMHKGNNQNYWFVVDIIHTWHASKYGVGHLLRCHFEVNYEMNMLKGTFEVS